MPCRFSSRRPDELDESLRRYAVEELPRRLAQRPTVRGEVTVRRFSRGRASHVRLVKVGDLGEVVLRVWFRRKHSRRVAGYLPLRQLLHRHDIPVPRILFVDDSKSTLERYGFWAAAEEYLNGQIGTELPCEARVAATLSFSGVLARLHAIRHDAPGKPWEGGVLSVERHVKREAAVRLERIRSLDPGLDRRRSRKLAAWFVEQFRALHRTEFLLTHGDAHAANLVVTSEGKIHLIDFAAMRYWFPEADLVVATSWLGRFAPAQVPRFLDRYFGANASSPALTREAYRASLSLFLAWMYLRMAASRGRRARRSRERGGPERQQIAADARRFWTRAESSIRERGGP